MELFFLYVFMSHVNNITTQVLHIIDEVLVPVLTTNTATHPVSNPDAFLFLNQTDNIDVGEHRVRSYRHRVQIAQKESVFKKEGRHTYFIPVDEGFKVSKFYYMLCIFLVLKTPNAFMDIQ